MRFGRSCKPVPETARIWHTHDGENEGHWHSLAVETVSVGTKVQVRPGERIPLDGDVVEGVSAVNEAAITGEALPVEKSVGDTVFAGTLNGNGVLVFTVHP